LVAGALALLVSACGEEIVHDLAEAEANRVLSRLSREEIQAEKIVQADGRWAISVSKQDASQALRLLDTRRVIASRPQDGAPFAKSGIVPSRDEQRFYYERALAAVLEETLHAMTGVLEAHVHVHLPHSDPFFRDKATTAGSSAVLLLVDELFTAAPEDVAALIGGAAGVPAKAVAVLKTVVAPRAVQAAQTAAGAPTTVPEPPVQAGQLDGNSSAQPTNRALALQTLSYDQVMLLVGTIGFAAVLFRIRRRRLGRARHAGVPSIEYEA
jgi:type III secretion protein J